MPWNTIQPYPDLDACRSALFKSKLSKKYYIWKYRQLALDKIMTLSSAYVLGPDTLASAVSIFDKYLAKCSVAGHHAVAVCTDDVSYCAMACFVIAIKLKEVASPVLAEMVQDASAVAQIAAFEVKILVLLDWCVHDTTGNWALPIIFLRNCNRPE